MTERKAFKRRVRDEMARTGRGYAQTAARLEASNPVHERTGHAASSLVVELLGASGLRLDPVAAYGIGGGVGFMYALFTYREVPHPLLTLVCQHHPQPWAPAMLERLEVDHLSVSGVRGLRGLLAEGRPLIVPIDRADAHWGARPALAEREEQLVLVRPEGDGFRVSDGADAVGTMSGEAVVTSYGSAKRTHPVVALGDAATLPDDLGPALAAGLEATVRGMTEPVLGNSFDVNFGLSGLRRWGERVVSTRRDGWRAMFADDEVWRARLVDCIDREHTAPTAGRPLFARVLRSLGHASAAEQFEQSAESWRRISIAAGEGTLDLAALAADIDVIAGAESAGIAELGARVVPQPD